MKRLVNQFPTGKRGFLKNGVNIKTGETTFRETNSMFNLLM